VVVQVVDIKLVLAEQVDPVVEVDLEVEFLLVLVEQEQVILDQLNKVILVVQDNLIHHMRVLVVVVQEVLVMKEIIQVKRLMVVQVFNFHRHSKILLNLLVRLVLVVKDIGSLVEVVEEHNPLDQFLMVRVAEIMDHGQVVAMVF
tara:strand:- start:125 stop:559 length:435 start_codon:yes stop_codon:yes gene_type:complete